MILLRVVIVLAGVLLQAIVAMVFFELHRAYAIEPMERWYPWLAYIVGGGFGGVLWWSGLRKLSRTFRMQRHGNNDPA